MFHVEPFLSKRLFNWQFITNLPSQGSQNRRQLCEYSWIGMEIGQIKLIFDYPWISIRPFPWKVPLSLPFYPVWPTPGQFGFEALVLSHSN